MKKVVVMVIVGIVLAGVGFAGGVFASPLILRAGAPAGLARLTEDERRQLQTMTPEQRTQFFKEKGINVPTGGPGGGMMFGGPDGSSGTGAPGGRGGTRLLDGTVQSVDAEKMTVTLTDGGSATVYLDASTVRATAASSTATPAVGAKVLVVSVPEAAGVSAAKAIIVK